jgi:hypothetical protein
MKDGDEANGDKIEGVRNLYGTGLTKIHVYF